MVSTSDCYAGGLLIESIILPLLKHACGEATSCHAGCKEVGRCHTRDESQGMYITYISAKCKKLPTLTLKPRGDITTSPKQGYQWPHRKDLSIKLKKKQKKLEIVSWG